MASRPARRRPDGWAEREGGALSVIVVAAVFGLCAVPMLQLVAAASFSLGAAPAEALALLTGPAIRRATVNSLAIAAGSTLLAAIVGGAVALALATMTLRTRRLLAFIFVLSLMVSPQISALSFKTLAGPSSPILNLIGLAPPPGTANPMLGFGGIILVMGLHHAPLFAIVLAAGLARVPKALVEAARVDGASPSAIVRDVILPVVRLNVLSAILLCFVAGVGNFGIPALLGLPVGVTTLPTAVYRQLASFGPGAINDAALVSLLIAVIAGAAVAASAHAMARNDVRTEAEAGLEPFVRSRALTVPAEAVLWLFFALTIMLPLASLVAKSLVPTYGVALSPDTLTVAHYVEILWNQALTRRAFTNSLAYAGAAAVLLAVLSFALAYATDRRLARRRVPILVVAELPYAVPGVVVAIACILLFVRPLPVLGTALYGTSWIIVFAYLSSFLAIALKPALAAIASLDRGVEEAALVDGASMARRLVTVILPAALPSLVAGASMVFLLAFNELTISALLWSAGTETLGVALLNLEDAGLAAEAAALAVVATGVIVLLMLALDGASRHFPEDALPWRQLGGR